MLDSSFRLKSQRGASIIEFALIIIALVAFTGAVIDFGLGLQRYNQVTHIVANFAQKAAKGGAECARDIEDKLSHELQSELANISSGTNATIHVRTPSDGNPNPPLISSLYANATVPLNCFFCLLLPGGIQLTTTQVAMVEMTECR